MKFVLDLLPLKSGGGVQVGLGFLRSLAEKSYFGHDWKVLCTDGTAVAHRVTELEFPEVCLIGCSVWSRLTFEYLGGSARWMREADAVVTLFGPGLPRWSSRTPRLVISAYSYLYYPELDFWADWPPHRRLLHRAKAKARLRRTLSADAWMFETEEIRRRAVDLYGLPRCRTSVIPLGRRLDLGLGASDREVILRRDSHLGSPFRVLLLTGWDRNKNVHMLPEIAGAVEELAPGCRISFVATLDPNSREVKEMRDRADRAGVGDRILTVGGIPPESVAELYASCDAVLLMSLLESASNNVLEAWEARRPLLITDAAWARETCGDAAVYVRRNEPFHIAAQILRVASDPSVGEAVVRKGARALTDFPTASERASAVVAFAERTAAAGPR